MKNRSKNGTKIEVRFNIDFGSILDRFWLHFGYKFVKNIDPENHRKMTLKKNGPRGAKRPNKTPGPLSAPSIWDAGRG